MTYRHAVIGLAVAAIIANVPASAQTYADGVRRGATAEAADFADGIGWINRVVDSDDCVGFGDSVLSARVVLGAASVAAGQSTSARATADSLLMTGSMWVENVQTAVDARHLFFPHTGVEWIFHVASAGTFSLRGQRSGSCNAMLFVSGPQGDTVEYRLPSGPTTFEYTGSLPGPGFYGLSLGLDRLHSSSATLHDQDRLDFDLSIYRPQAVSAETASWGLVKAQYR